MITQEYLNDYECKIKNYTYEINKLTKEIIKENKKGYIDSVSGSSNRYPYEARHFSLNGISKKEIEKKEKRKDIFENKKKKLEKELKYKLDNLEDRLLADIIEKKYIKGMDWKQISMKLNYAGESGSRNYFNRYFEKK